MSGIRSIRPQRPSAAGLKPRVKLNSIMPPALIQSAQCQTVFLADINLQDEEFRITTCEDPAALLQSIQQEGLIVPPLLIKQEAKFTVISGFRRLAACQMLGWKQVTARIVNPEQSYLKCLRLAIAENAYQRPLNLIETSRAIQKLSAFLNGPQQWNETAAVCGLPTNFSIINKIKNLCLLPAPIQSGILHDTISLTMANELAKLETKSAVVFARIFDQLKFSLNKQREMVSLVSEIARREDKSTYQVLANDQFQNIMADDNLDRGQKGRLIRLFLRQWRYPRIVAAEEKYDHHIKNLKLGRDIKLIPPKDFEGNDFGLNLSFKNLAHLKKLQSKLDQIILHPSFKKIIGDDPIPQADRSSLD